MNGNRFIQKPRYCCWVINYRCMSRCKICHIWNIDADKNAEPTMEQRKRFVDSLRGLVDPGFEFHLSGGEPLLTEDVLDLVKFISGNGFKTDLVTNGYLIGESLARDIVTSGLDTLTISLDGINSETHDFIRGVKGSYDRVMKAIEYVDKFRKGEKPKIALLTIIMEHNLDEILKLVEWAEHDARIAMISFQAITQPFGQAPDNSWFRKDENRFLWPQDTARTADTMEMLKSLRLKGYKIGNHPNHFLHFREYFKDPNRFLKKIKCNLGDYEFHIDPYGKTFFCCLMEPFGNIKTDNLPQMWYSRRAEEIRKNIYSCRQNCHIMINCFYEDGVFVNDQNF